MERMRMNMTERRVSMVHTERDMENPRAGSGRRGGEGSRSW